MSFLTSFTEDEDDPFGLGLGVPAASSVPLLSQKTSASSSPTSSSAVDTGLLVQIDATPPPAHSKLQVLSSPEQDWDLLQVRLSLQLGFAGTGSTFLSFS